MQFGTRVSIPAILPNGHTRIIQYSKNTLPELSDTFSATWLAQVEGVQRAISGYVKLGKTINRFWPKKENELEWILKTHTVKRTRLPSPKTEEEYKKNQAIIHNARFEAIKAKEQKFGEYVTMPDGRKLRMQYLSGKNDSSYGYVTSSGVKYFGTVNLDGSLNISHSKKINRRNRLDIVPTF